MRKSKFVGKEFDNGWFCSGCNLRANYGHSTKHNKYWYGFTKLTDDGKFSKWIRVEAHEATKIYKGELLVEDLANQKEEQRKHLGKVNYNFINKKPKE